MKSLIATFAAAVALVSTAPAMAGVFITTDTQGDLTKVFGSGGNQVSNVVTGVIDGTSTVVNFSSTTLLSLDGSGYAQISGVVFDGLKPNGDPKYKAAGYSNFNISLADPTLGFKAIEFNALTKTTIYADITANLASGGSVPLLNYVFGNGNNFYRIYTTDDDIITSLNFVGYTTAGGTTPADWDQFKQVDIDAVTIPTTSPVPEPATWGLMIVGFGLMGGMLRRDRRRALLAAAA